MINKQRYADNLRIEHELGESKMNDGKRADLMRQELQGLCEKILDASRVARDAGLKAQELYLAVREMQSNIGDCLVDFGWNDAKLKKPIFYTEYLCLLKNKYREEDTFCKVVEWTDEGWNVVIACEVIAWSSIPPFKTVKDVSTICE